MNILRDERGVATLLMLIVVPVLLMVLVAVIVQTQVVTGSDIDLQRGLENAVRAAAMQVTEDSQAAGTPKIHAARAHAAFRKKLASCLGLDEASLTPLPGALYKTAPGYVLAIYNGDGRFASSGCPAGYRFSFTGGVPAGGEFAGAGFPCDFGVTESNIFPGGGGVINVSLDSPGCVAVVSAELTEIAGSSDSLTTARWAAARVVWKGE